MKSLVPRNSSFCEDSPCTFTALYGTIPSYRKYSFIGFTILKLLSHRMPPNSRISEVLLRPVVSTSKYKYFKAPPKFYNH